MRATNKHRNIRHAFEVDNIVKFLARKSARQDEQSVHECSMKEKSRRLFGEMLIADDVITRSQLDEAIAEQGRERTAGGEVARIGVILNRLGYLEKEALEKYIERVMQEYL